MMSSSSPYKRNTLFGYIRREENSYTIWIKTKIKSTITPQIKKSFKIKVRIITTENTDNKENATVKYYNSKDITT